MSEVFLTAGIVEMIEKNLIQPIYPSDLFKEAIDHIILRYSFRGLWWYIVHTCTKLVVENSSILIRV